MRSPSQRLVAAIGLCAAVHFIVSGTFGHAATTEQAGEAPIERFQRVDERLFRGAQPSEAGLRRLRDMGVKTVINLRLEEDAKRTDEKRIVESLGMKYESLPIRDQSFFTQSRRIPDETIRAFFKLIDSAEPGPIFVHCQRGADRTGALVAFYRVARNGWDSERAAKEAREVGMRSYYTGLQRQIREFSPAALQTSAQQ
jgi:tyrosine-protein phosphatase SIW14